jgi:N-acetylmuramic acid 6-phosphate etherase
LADITIALRVGPEIIAGSTRLKSGTATKLVLNMLTTCAMIQIGKVYGNRMVDLEPRSRKLVERGIRLVRELTDLTRPKAEKIFWQSGGRVKTAVVMAHRGLNRSQAREALKAADGFLRRALE